MQNLLIQKNKGKLRQRMQCRRVRSNRNLKRGEGENQESKVATLKRLLLSKLKVIR